MPALIVMSSHMSSGIQLETWTTSRNHSESKGTKDLAVADRRKEAAPAQVLAYFSTDVWHACAVILLREFEENLKQTSEQHKCGTYWFHMMACALEIAAGCELTNLQYSIISSAFDNYCIR